MTNYVIKSTTSAGAAHLQPRAQGSPHRIPDMPFAIRITCALAIPVFAHFQQKAIVAEHNALQKCGISHTGDSKYVSCKKTCALER